MIKYITECKLNDEVVFSFTHFDSLDADNWMIKFQNSSDWNPEFAVTTTEVDITDQMALKDAIENQAADIAFGKDVLLGILTTLNSKSYSDSEIDDLYDSAILTRIQRMLETGAIQNARRNINDADLTGILTSSEKTALLSKLDTYLG